MLEPAEEYKRNDEKMSMEQKKEFLNSM